MTALKWLAALSCLGYLGVVAAVFLGQRRIIYPIPETTRTAPQAAGLAAGQEHRLKTADGERIIVWHVPAQGGRHVVLYFPGNGDVLARMAGRLRAISADGIGVVAVSYRGYGGSTGSPGEAGLIEDAAAAYEFARQHYAADRIVPWGFSLGTGVAVTLAAERSVGGLILEAPFTSLADVAAAAFPLLPVRHLIKDQFRSDARIARVGAPLLVMQGGRDDVVPPALGQRLFALANEPKELVLFPQGGHNDLDAHGATEAAQRFIASLKK